MNPELRHHEALAHLDNGKPLSCLLIWHELLLTDTTGIESHLNAAASTLHTDPIASIRSKAICLLQNLLNSKPGQHEVSALGELLQAWGNMCYSEAPQRALQHWERAWSCSTDIMLAQKLAHIYKRLGFFKAQLFSMENHYYMMRLLVLNLGHLFPVQPKVVSPVNKLSQQMNQLCMFGKYQVDPVICSDIQIHGTTPMVWRFRMLTDTFFIAM